MPLAPGMKLGPYEVQSPLGTGGMGEVYRARDCRLNRDVAVKVLPAAFSRDPERMARFEREAQVLASLNHPNIAAIYGLEEKDAVPALVMELVEGPTLASRIASGRMCLEDVLPIALQIAEALDFAHEKGVIHRDLKPANVKLTADGTVKVLDFGLAKMLDNSESSVADPANSPTFASATKMGVVLGTAAYMSPEQARGKPVDRRTDIWSFGCLLYEMLTGKQAFSGETITDTLAAVVRAEPEWSLLPNDTHALLHTLLRRCLQKDPKERLRDIGDARVELKQLLSGSAPNVIAGLSTAAHTRQRWWDVLPWTLAFICTLSALAVWFGFGARAPLQPAPIRFAITVPHMDDFGEIAISRDGSAIVFDTLPGGGPMGSQFYLRRLDQLTATPIPGTEQSSYPSFSPDGQWLSFFGNSGISKVRLDSGAVQALCPASAVIGATWADDNTVVFSQRGHGLFRVSTDGGTPELLASFGQQTGNRNYVTLSAVPGGKFVIATLVTEGALSDASQDLAIVRLDQPGKTQAPTILLRGANHARYVAPGVLLFIRGGSLFSIRFNLSQQKTIGNPIRVLDKVKVVADQPGFYFDASSTGTLVYSPAMEQNRLAVLVDRQGREQPLNLPPRTYWDPQLSPDSKLLAFSIDSGSGHQNAWVYNLDRHTWIRLGFDQRQEMAPVWTPDGKRLLYITNQRELFSKPADGSGQEQLIYKAHSILFLTSITPDGGTLIGEELRENNWDIVTLRLKNGAGVAEGDTVPLVSTPAVEWRPQLSPDGHWLAYVSDESGSSEVYVRAYPGPGGKWQVSAEGGNEPRWSGKGRELFYLNGNAMMAVDVRTSPTFNSAKPRVLFKGAYESPGGVMNYVVTPDGQKFIMLKKQAQASPPEVDVVMNWAGGLLK